MPAKIVVTEEKKGSRISLLGSSGKELLGSVVFSEPRAKGATLRALKGLLGDISVEDRTIRPPRTAAARAQATAQATAPSPPDAGETPTRARGRTRASKPSAQSDGQAGPSRRGRSTATSGKIAAAAIEEKDSRTRTAKLRTQEDVPATSEGTGKPRTRKSTKRTSSTPA